MTETLITEGQNTQAADPLQGEQTPVPAAAEKQAATGEATQAEASAGEAQPQGAPEKYEFTSPEGKTLDPDTLTAFSEVAKELNLPQDAAQKVLDKMAPAIAQRQAAQIEQIRTDWAEASKADKEFGGDKLDQSLATARKALDTFGSPELRALLNDAGLGNHPEVIRFMFRAGKAISEDTKFVGGKPAPQTKRDTASVLYPNQK